MSIVLKKNTFTFNGSSLSKQNKLTVASAYTMNADSSLLLLEHAFDSDDQLYHVRVQMRARFHGVTSTYPASFTLVCHCEDNSQPAIDLTDRSRSDSTHSIVEADGYLSTESPINKTEIRMQSPPSATFSIPQASVFDISVQGNEAVLVTSTIG